MEQTTLEERLAHAEKGRQFWNGLTKECAVDSSKIVILMPREGKEYHRELIENLADFAEKSKLTEVVFLLEENEDFDRIKDYIQKQNFIFKVNLLKITRENVLNLLALHQLYHFTNRLIIDAFENVEDADAGRLIGCNGITKRDVIRIAILGLTE